MGIYIKDIPTPKAGQEIEIAIGITGILYARIKSSFDEWHEITEVPTHGRLIDADALLESIKEARKKDPEIEDVYIDDYFTVAEWVVSAPTIIGSENEE